MAAPIVYNHVAEDAELETGGLFDGKKFWVAQRVPQRAHLLDLIRANGGQPVPLEKQADWMIADHVRRDCPPGTISYEFVRKSIAKGEILDPNDFPAGPRTGTARDPGSLTRPAKGARNAYTPDEDRILYKWVKDAAASGVPVSGNELYKQLEQQHPRHTWQSWRDRYLKQLQNRPPSAFNIPDNAPPSPPSDQSSRAPEQPVPKAPVARAPATQTPVVEAPVAKKSGLVKNKDKARKEEYTLDQLEATFSTEDWEELYAFVEEMDGVDKMDVAYGKAWEGWANQRDNQTAEQWRQYYEKVVRPQWQQDPASKRQRVREMVQERYIDDSSSPTKSQSWNPLQDKTVASQSQEVAPTHPSKPAVSETLPSDSRLEPESTAQQETPRHIKDGYESALKRIRGEADGQTSTEQPRPTKMRKRVSLSPEFAGPEETADVGTQAQPLEISSAETSQQTSVEHLLPEEALQSQTQEQGAPLDEEDGVESMESDDDFPQLAPIPRPLLLPQDSDDDRSVASSTDIARIAPLPRPPRIPEDDEDENDEDDLSTPRASRPTTFDTQAILSSPSQLPTHISALPRPPLDSSPPQHPESDASTTQSIEEFRQSLTGTDMETQTQPHFHPLPRPASPTPSATSEGSSAGSGDPDEPLAADEMDDFFAAQHASGFSNDFVIAALKRTRFRPGLARRVLEAWREGRALPVQRGIWSAEEDELVETGDGKALARLQRKHTLDGWGGITERLNWLNAWRSR